MVSGDLRMVAMVALAGALVSGCAFDDGWKAAREAGTREAYEAYLGKHEGAPRHGGEARRAIADLDWEAAWAADTLEAYRAFIERYGEAAYAAQQVALARAELPGLEWQRIRARGSRRAAEAFVRRFQAKPDQAALVRAARALIAGDDADWAHTVAASSADASAAYLAAHPQGAHADKAERWRVLQRAAEAPEFCLEVTLTGDAPPGREQRLRERLSALTIPYGRTGLPADGCGSPVAVRVLAGAEAAASHDGGDNGDARRRKVAALPAPVRGSIRLAHGGTVVETGVVSLPLWFEQWNVLAAGPERVLAHIVDTHSHCGGRRQAQGIQADERAVATLDHEYVKLALGYPDRCLWTEADGAYPGPLRLILLEAGRLRPEATTAAILDALDDRALGRARQAVLLRSLARVEAARPDTGVGYRPLPAFGAMRSLVLDANDPLADTAMTTLCEMEAGRNAAAGWLIDAAVNMSSSSLGPELCVQRLRLLRRSPWS